MGFCGHFSNRVKAIIIKIPKTKPKTAILEAFGPSIRIFCNRLSATAPKVPHTLFQLRLTIVETHSYPKVARYDSLYRHLPTLIPL
jgi:hypothetical protein